MKRKIVTGVMASIISFIFTGSLCLTFPTYAEAGLYNHTITWQYYADGTGVYDPPPSFVAGKETSKFEEISIMSAKDLSATESQIIIDFIFPPLGSGDAQFPVGLKSEIQFTVTDISFNSVSLDTNMFGLDMTDIKWDPHNITIDVSALFFNFDTYININVTTPSTPVPEPATMLLFGSGLVGLLAGGRMIKRR